MASDSDMGYRDGEFMRKDLKEWLLESQSCFWLFVNYVQQGDCRTSAKSRLALGGKA